MGRVFGILLLSTFIWVQTPVIQLLKVSTLIEHYYEHRLENNELSIIDYLALHYVHDTDRHPGHDRDMQLPFKQGTSIAFATVFFEQVKFDLPQECEYMSIAQTISQYKSPYQAKEALSRIWQPPRGA